MTGPQLKLYRESLGLSQRDLAQRLRDVTHATISRWEEKEEEIPYLVSKELLRQTDITLPVEQLQQLFRLCEKFRLPFDKLLQRALREFIARETGEPITEPDVSDAALKEQTAAIRKLLKQSAEPPALRIAEHPEELAGGAGGEESHAKRRKPGA